MNSEKSLSPAPGLLRRFECMLCGLDNSDPSWRLVGDRWVHVCPLVPPERPFEEDDPTPVTDPMSRERWSPKE